VLVWVYLTAEPTSQAQGGNDFDFQIQTDDYFYFFTDSGSSTVSVYAASPFPRRLQYSFLASARFLVPSERYVGFPLMVGRS
jgi:hypothetical protein